MLKKHFIHTQQPGALIHVSMFLLYASTLSCMTTTIIAINILVRQLRLLKKDEPWFSVIPGAVVHEGFLLIHGVLFKPIHPLELLQS